MYGKKRRRCRTDPKALIKEWLEEGYRQGREIRGKPVWDMDTKEGDIISEAGWANCVRCFR